MVQFWLEGVQMEDYVFFFIDLFAEGLGGRGPVRPWYRGDQDDSAARQAFKVIHLLNSCFCATAVVLVSSSPAGWMLLLTHILSHPRLSECEDPVLPGASDSRVPTFCAEPEDGREEHV